jgi:hypothetical protein
LRMSPLSPPPLVAVRTISRRKSRIAMKFASTPATRLKAVVILTQSPGDVPIPARTATGNGPDTPGRAPSRDETQLDRRRPMPLSRDGADKSAIAQRSNRGSWRVQARAVRLRSGAEGRAFLESPSPLCTLSANLCSGSQCRGCRQRSSYSLAKA